MSITEKEEYKRVWRHGQFYVGVSVADPGLPGWQKFALNEKLDLWAHPNLSATQVRTPSASLTLVGYAIDPKRPSNTDREILERLTAEAAFFKAPYEHTDALGGRWLMVVAGPDSTIVFSDAAGTRQLVYFWDATGRCVSCASDPGLIAELNSIALDKEAQDFQDSPGFKANQEYWFPGWKTPFKDIKRLLPNFYLNLDAGVCHRFWPRSDFRELSGDEALSILSERLPRMMEGILSRGPVVLSLTAGIDSRMVLAAGRDHTQAMTLVTVQQRQMGDDHPDLTIPKTFGVAHGMTHRIVRGDGEIRPVFRTAVNNSISFYHESWISDAQAIYDGYHQDMTTVIGSTAETGRLFYDTHLGYGQPATPAELLKLMNLGDHPFAQRAVAEWRQTLPEIYNYNLADLFYWEQRAGRWLASSLLEFGLAWKEIFAPFNSREVLSTMLSVDPALRRPPESLLFKDLIQTLWPELLKEPINPHEQTRRPSFVRRAARKLLPGFARSVYRKLKG